MNQTQDHAWAYDPETHVLTGLVSLQPDPLNPGTFFSKPNTVMFAPPAMPEGIAARAVETGGLWKWETIPDPAIPTEPTLEELRSGALTATELWYWEARNSGFSWGGHTFQSDPAAREALLTCNAGGKGTRLGYWRDVANVDVPDGSVTMIQSLVNAMLDQGELLFVQRGKLRAWVKAATVPELKDFDPAVKVLTV